MPQPIATLYRGSSGLANRVPPELISYNPETGIAGLQEAKNVLIGEAGQLYGRKGSRQVFSTEACHSPFPFPGGLLFVQEKEAGAILTMARPDSTGQLSITELGQLTYRGSWLSWFELAGEYWFSTERERGLVTSDFELKNWPVSTGMMEDSHSFEYGALPFGRHIDMLGGFTLSANNNSVFFSEPGQPTLCRTAENNLAVEGKIRLIAATQDGVFVSDDKQVWYFSGRAPRKWAVRRVLNSPAIEYCRVHGLVPASDVGIDAGGLGVVFMTVDGPCFGASDGSILNLTDKQFSMPNCDFSRGSMMIVNDSTIIISVT